MRTPLAVFALSVPLLTGLAVLVSGFGMAWDFLNYHYYDGYAVFHDRSHDIAPAGLHTYFNPTSEMAFYLGWQYLPPRWFGFLFGFFSGLNIPLVFFLARRVLYGPYASLLALLCALFAATSTNFAIEIASVNHDNLVSLFFIAGLIALMAGTRPMVMVAGVLMGLGVGLKLTLMPFLAATGAFLPLLYRDRRAMAVMALFALAALLGLLITSGWWMAHLWHRYGNPLFPMFNTLFHSPYAAADSYADHRFLPRGVWEQIAYPLFFSFDFRKAGVNMPVHDYRYVLTYLGFILAALAYVLRRPAADTNLMKSNVAWFFIAVTAASYLLWLMTFGVSRYLLPLDLILPLVALAWMQILGLASWRALTVWGVVFALLGFTASHPWRGQHSWNDKLMAVAVPPVSRNTLVVMAGTGPMAYLIPAFPPQVPFVRVSLEDGFGPAASGGITAISSPALLAKQAREAIATHSGPLAVLFSHIKRKERQEMGIVATTLHGLHLEIVPGSCKPVVPTISYVDQTYVLCELRRV